MIGPHRLECSETLVNGSLASIVQVRFDIGLILNLPTPGSDLYQKINHQSRSPSLRGRGMFYISVERWRLVNPVLTHKLVLNIEVERA